MNKCIFGLLFFSFSLLSGMEEAKKASIYSEAANIAQICCTEYFFDFIKKHNLDVNQPFGNNEDTLVHCAAQCMDIKEGEIIIFRLVREYKANIMAKNKKGRTPLDIAVEFYSLGAMKSLLKIMIDKEILIFHSLLDIACQADNKDYSSDGKRIFRAIIVKKYADKYGYKYTPDDQSVLQNYVTQYGDKEYELILRWLKTEKRRFKDCRKVVKQELKSENVDNITVVVTESPYPSLAAASDELRVIFVNKTEFSKLPEAVQRVVIRHEIEHLKQEYVSQLENFHKKLIEVYDSKVENFYKKVMVSLFKNDKQCIKKSVSALSRKLEFEADRVAFKKYPQAFLELCQLMVTEDEFYTEFSLHPTWKEREKKARNYMVQKEMIEKYGKIMM